MPRRLAAIATLAAALLLAACGTDGERASTDAAADGRPTVVVTYAILGAVVSDVVGDAAKVEVLIPNGTDPHEWSPSAQDAERVRDADLVVANGLGLEESLADVLAEAEADGVPVFRAGDHVEVRAVVDGETGGSGEDADHAEEHAPGADDPHIWTSPRTLAAAVEALGPALAQATGLDVTAGTARETAALAALDAEVEAILAPVPAAQRRLVTGHESLGYFADRYGFELVGAVIPSLSSQAEASAKDLTALAQQIRAAGVRTVFTELGTSSQVADVIAEETGARVVELPTHALPDAGGYAAYMRALATRVRDGLLS